MAGLADDWPKNRQTCVDVLCAYLRMPYEPHPGQAATAREVLAFMAARQVRHTVIRVITSHLQPDDGRAATIQDWRGLDFDLTGVVFDGGSFEYAHFSGGMVDFNHAEFSGRTVSFNYAVFSGSRVNFSHGEFSGGTVNFRRCYFSGPVNFSDSRFSDGEVNFTSAKFRGGQVNMNRAEFCGSHVNFTSTRFSGTKVFISDAKFSGGTVDFNSAEFSGGTVDFSGAADWSVPPKFPWTGTPPPVVKLPQKQDQFQA